MPDTIDAGPLTLVRWNTDDADDVLAAIRSSINELRPWMPWAHSVPTREQQRDAFTSGRAAFDAGTDFQYVFRETATSELVGGGGVHRRVGPGAAEIGYWVRTDRHGRGYATAAAHAMTEASFAHLADVDRVEIHMDRANAASARVPEKLGYRLVRTDPRDGGGTASTGELLVWIVTRAEWPGA